MLELKAYDIIYDRLEILFKVAKNGHDEKPEDSGLKGWKEMVERETCWTTFQAEG